MIKELTEDDWDQGCTFDYGNWCPAAEAQQYWAWYYDLCTEHGIWYNCEEMAYLRSHWHAGIYDAWPDLCNQERTKFKDVGVEITGTWCDL